MLDISTGIHDRKRILKYNGQLEKIENDDGLYVDTLIYKILEEFLNNLKINISSLEVFYNEYTSKLLVDNQNAMKTIAFGWIRFLKILKELEGLLSSYDEMYPNIEYYKSIPRSSKVCRLKIDLLLRDKDVSGVDILCIVPMKNDTHDTTKIIENLDTILAIDYLLESNVKINKIITLSYSNRVDSILMNSVKVNQIYFTKTIAQYVHNFMQTMNRSSVNLSYCGMCDFSQKCNIKRRV